MSPAVEKWRELHCSFDIHSLFSEKVKGTDCLMFKAGSSPVGTVGKASGEPEQPERLPAQVSLCLLPSQRKGAKICRTASLRGELSARTKLSQGAARSSASAGTGGAQR